VVTSTATGCLRSLPRARCTTITGL
jgi:hypothetical protein